MSFVMMPRIKWWEWTVSRFRYACAYAVLTSFSNIRTASVCFRNCRSGNLIASPITSLGSATKRPRSAALTLRNLESHLKSLPREDVESIPEPVLHDSATKSENRTNSSRDKTTDQDSSENHQVHSSSVSESNNTIVKQLISLPVQGQSETIEHYASVLGGTSKPLLELKEFDSESVSYDENRNVNLSSTSEDIFLEQKNHLPLSGQSNNKENEAPMPRKDERSSRRLTVNANPKRVSLEPLPVAFKSSSVGNSTMMGDKSSEHNRPISNKNVASARSVVNSLQKPTCRENGNALRLITPATNTHVMKSSDDQIRNNEAQGSKRSQTTETRSPINAAVHSVVKPMKLDFRSENTLPSLSRAILPENSVARDPGTDRKGLMSEAFVDHVIGNGILDPLSTDQDHNPRQLTWGANLPSFHDVFYGVHDVDDHVEATPAMLRAYEFPDPPHSTLDMWLSRIGAFFYPDSAPEQSDARIVGHQFRHNGWLFFQACCHDIFFGAHDELQHIEISADELASTEWATVSSYNRAFFSWSDELWEGASVSIDSFEFFFLNWFLAIVCLVAFLPLLQYIADVLLSFDLPHENTNVCDPERVGYWSSYPCEYLPTYWASYFSQAQNNK